MHSRDGRVVLIDFGLARAVSPAAGTAIGTGGYAPPEQYQGLAELAPASAAIASAGIPTATDISAARVPAASGAGSAAIIPTAL